MHNLKFTTQTSLPRRTAHGDCGPREKKQELSLPLQVRKERQIFLTHFIPISGPPRSSLSLLLMLVSSMKIHFKKDNIFKILVFRPMWSHFHFGFLKVFNAIRASVHPERVSQVSGAATDVYKN